jgi:hypothetical protein
VSDDQLHLKRASILKRGIIGNMPEFWVILPTPYLQQEVERENI